MESQTLKDWGPEKLAFGPVPSRRLGRSLGVNNIPPKICSYSCIYCQLGRTKDFSAVREHFFGPERIFEAVQGKVKSSEEKIDHITFVPDGEPTMDLDLGRSIERISVLGIDTAVITNSSLMSRQDVRDDLSGADLVSLKIDTVDSSVWKKIDRPHGDLKLDGILEGIGSFAGSYRGTLETETMMVKGINDSSELMERTARFIGELSPKIANISIPTRPPAEDWVSKPDEESLNNAYQIFRDHVDEVRLLIGYEGSSFSSLNEFESDILSITSVHPMREDAVRKLLERKGKEWDSMERLLEKNAIKRVDYEGRSFYLRNFEQT
ncbi:MAG: radical SAM protein [Candidatus Thermoplasmatota archaeon]|nr:radical SAM protein [Candidatus Thermoplasmatota archaeon]